MNDDVKTSVMKLNNCNQDEFDFYARAYLRAYASWIEGNIWMYKELIRRIETQWYKNLSTEYQLYLFEYDWKIKNNGEPVLQQKRIKTIDNLKGLFFVLSHIFEDFSIDRGQKGWENVLYFYTIRDRTMHPTNLDSFKISKSDIEKCDNGRVWLEDIFIDLSSKIYEKTKS